MKKGSFLEVDVHPNFRTFMEHKAFLSAWCRTFMHTREKNVFFLNDLKISLSPAPREGPFYVMIVETSMDSGSQDATKMTSALTDRRIFSFMNMMTLYMCINHFLSIPPSFSSVVVTMSTSMPTGVCRIKDTVLICNLTKRLWNQKDSQMQLVTQGF